MWRVVENVIAIIIAITLIALLILHPYDIDNYFDNVFHNIIVGL
jgi:hypothetical protein